MRNVHLTTANSHEPPSREWGLVTQVVAFLIGFFPFFSIALTNIVFYLFFMLWLVDVFRKRTTLRPHQTPFDYVLLTYLVFWVVAAVAGFSPLASLKKIMIFQYPLMFYVILFAYRGSLIPSVLYGLGIGAGLNVFYGWAQFVLWEWVYDYAGGSRPEWLMMVGEKWQKYITLSPGQGRIHGAFHLLTYSELLLVPFLYCGARFLERKKNAFFFLAFLLSGGALILTAERGPFLGAFFGIALIGFHHPRRHRLIGPVSLLALMMWFNPVFMERLGGAHSSKLENLTLSTPVASGVDPVTESNKGNKILLKFSLMSEIIQNNHRFILWQGGLYIASRHLFLGVGPGQIGPVTAIYKKNADFPPNPMGQESDLHSFYMQRLVEMGLPGLVVSLWVIFVLFATGRKFYRCRETISNRFASFQPESIHALSLAVWALFLSYGIINLTERAFDDAEVSIVFWILAATSVWFTRHASEMNERGS